jgi:hypothetical protein
MITLVSNMAMTYQLVKTYLVYGTQRFIAVLTKAYQWTL